MMKKYLSREMDAQQLFQPRAKEEPLERPLERARTFQTGTAGLIQAAMRANTHSFRLVTL